jgi:hypothetical protein
MYFLCKGVQVNRRYKQLTATGETLPDVHFVPNPPSYQLCYTKCLYCTGPGTDDKQNCIQCNTGLYMADNTDNCYPKDKQIPGHYFDTNS